MLVQCPDGGGQILYGGQHYMFNYQPFIGRKRDANKRTADALVIPPPPEEFPQGKADCADLGVGTPIDIQQLLDLATDFCLANRDLVVRSSNFGVQTNEEVNGNFQLLLAVKSLRESFTLDPGGCSYEFELLLTACSQGGGRIVWDNQEMYMFSYSPVISHKTIADPATLDPGNISLTAVSTTSSADTASTVAKRDALTARDPNPFGDPNPFVSTYCFDTGLPSGNIIIEDLIVFVDHFCLYHNDAWLESTDPAWFSTEQVHGALLSISYKVGADWIDGGLGFDQCTANFTILLDTCTTGGGLLYNEHDTYTYTLIPPGYAKREESGKLDSPAFATKETETRLGKMPATKDVGAVAAEGSIGRRGQVWHAEW